MDNKIYEVYAVRIENNAMLAVKTTLPDIVSAEHMKSLISVYGLDFFIINQAQQKIFWKFENDTLISPDLKDLQQLEQF